MQDDNHNSTIQPVISNDIPVSIPKKDKTLYIKIDYSGVEYVLLAIGVIAIVALLMGLTMLLQYTFIFFILFASAMIIHGVFAAKKEPVQKDPDGVQVVYVQQEKKGKSTAKRVFIVLSLLVLVPLALFGLYVVAIIIAFASSGV